MWCVRATTAVLGAYLGMGPPHACDSSAPKPGAAGDQLAEVRAEMVATQISARGVRDAAVLAAMRKVPRHEFVPSHASDIAYQDGPLPIG